MSLCRRLWFDGSGGRLDRGKFFFKGFEPVGFGDLQGKEFPEAKVEKDVLKSS